MSVCRHKHTCQALRYRTWMPFSSFFSSHQMIDAETKKCILISIFPKGQAPDRHKSLYTWWFQHNHPICKNWGVDSALHCTYRSLAAAAHYILQNTKIPHINFTVIIAWGEKETVTNSNTHKYKQKDPPNKKCKKWNILQIIFNILFCFSGKI